MPNPARQASHNAFLPYRGIYCEHKRACMTGDEAAESKWGQSASGNLGHVRQTHIYYPRPSSSILVKEMCAILAGVMEESLIEILIPNFQDLAPK
jgi:hypothetical protein